MLRKPFAYGISLWLALGLAACSDDAPRPGGTPPPNPNDGQLYLTIIGDRDISLQESESWRLAVKYHDAQGHAVAGQVAFALTGTTAGAQLDAINVSTDALGIAHVTVTAGTQAMFGVTASAPKANGVDWRLQVQKNNQIPPLRYAGTYHLESTLDVGGGFPGGLGMTFRTIDDLTDDPYDPATWLIDYALAQLNSPTITSIVNAFRPGLDSDLYNQITTAAPDLVANLRRIGQDVTAVARHFGTGSDLVVEAHTNPIDGTVTVVEKHTLKSVIFTLEGTRHELSFVSLRMPEPLAMNIPGDVQMQTTLLIGRHQFQVSYGRLILIALDQLIIPLLDPAASSMSQFLTDQINCVQVGASIANAVGVGTPAMWASACQNAITAVSNAIESEILRIDTTGAQLDWQGTATLVDHDSDRVVEALDPGRWTGTFLIAGQTSTLGLSASNAFHGTRTSP